MLPKKKILYQNILNGAKVRWRTERSNPTTYIRIESFNCWPMCTFCSYKTAYRTNTECLSTSKFQIEFVYNNNNKIGVKFVRCGFKKISQKSTLLFGCCYCIFLCKPHSSIEFNEGMSSMKSDTGTNFI